MKKVLSQNENEFSIDDKTKEGWYEMAFWYLGNCLALKLFPINHQTKLVIYDMEYWKPNFYGSA